MESQETVDTTQIQAQQAETAAPEQAQESQEQINWKKFREQREIERKQKLEAEKRAAEKEAEAAALKAAMESLLAKANGGAQAHPHAADPMLEDLSEDDRIQKKVEAALAAKERELERQRLEREQREFPQKLASTYSDFDKVCNTDNLDYLEYHYPEVAAAFRHMPDGYDKWSAVYKAVKRFVPNSTQSHKDEAKASKNAVKPQSMSVAGATGVGDTAPQYLDDKRRADNWARMQQVLKGQR